MDDFAQTGANQDDLFDDFADGEESMQTRAQDNLFGDELEPITEPEEASAPPRPTQDSTPRQPRFPARGRGTPRSRGRGRGNCNIQDTTQSSTIKTDTRANDKPVEAGTAEEEAPNRDLGSNATATEAKEVDAPEASPAASATPAKPPPVRGNRSATGGNARQKLTEEELAAKMEAIRLKNADLEAAHARAEADAASFEQRENDAAKRKQAERRDRQQMMGEREKNRQRKLKAQGGREWDSEKKEDEFVDQKRGFGRGAYGGVVGTRAGNGEHAAPRDEDGDRWAERQYMYREDRGRGGRGRGAGRGATARGGTSTTAAHAARSTRSGPQAEDFLSLSSNGPTTQSQQEDGSVAPKLSFPSKKKSTDATKDLNAPQKSDKTSWADMVEEARSAS